MILIFINLLSVSMILTVMMLARMNTPMMMIKYSHYDISDYSQVVVKSHDMKHSDYYFCNAYKYVIRMIL